MPVVVTATGDEREFARRTLLRGAFDLITLPVDREQTVRTVRLALWHSTLRTLIARKDLALATYQDHMDKYPREREQFEESFTKALALVEETIASVKGTILQLDESLVCFSDFATQVEHHVRQRALNRLGPVSGPAPTTVLLIDSQKEDREYWAQCLKTRSPGCIVLEAETGKAGLDLCRSQRVDCVVMELNLSDMSGFEVLWNLVPQAQHPRRPVVVLAKTVFAPMRQLALNNGARAYLVKGRTSGEELDRTIRTAIAMVKPTGTDLLT
ncbi:protein of unknown function [Nitrospira japonica]|uniref:Response regulatory domain-containing protein n=1 Tax=Nitrospira japonica TaxID=1325564 RepID=A0A1W1I8C9_9BACT|nr:response regulator [Nitrospira japonica]SLM49245.1 protein of unknown function [Nitrospira japonica]